MVLDNLLGLAAEAEGDAEAYEVAAREAVRTLVAPKGKVEPKLLGARAVRRPRLRLDRDLRRRSAPDAAMGARAVAKANSSC